MERLLHYVWKYKLYASTSLATTEGLPIAVIDPGIQNTDAGPDFFNAKIKIDGTVWAGSVEIHEKASDWLLHHHDSDKAYDSVILHVTGVNDASICRMNGEPIPQLLLSVPEPARKNIDWLLAREVPVLRHKFGLKPLDDSLFKSLRIRPTNFPHVKLAQLSAIWHRYDTLFSMILSASSPKEIKDYFRIQPSDYWKNHYHFQYASVQKDKMIGENALNILLINTVVPLLFAYGGRNKLPEYCLRATRLLESIPPERNHIVTAFARSGIEVHNAGDTQSLIQLKREYCEKRKCLYCRIGFRLLKRSVNPPR